MAACLKSFQDELPEGYINKGFLEYLKSEDYKVKEIIGDGNCLFRSIADLIDGDQEKHERYRRLAVQHFNLHQNQFEPFVTTSGCSFEQYVEKMSKNGTWGGHAELEALSVVLKRQFCVINESQEKVIIGLQADKSFKKYIWHMTEPCSIIAV